MRKERLNVRTLETEGEGREGERWVGTKEFGDRAIQSGEV